MVQQVTAHHLSRLACLYVRQSTLQQVMENTESTSRQYALRERARALGCPEERIVVDLPSSEWIALAKDAHVGYITWEDLERNEAQLVMNSQAYAPQRLSPPREGPALL